MRLTRKTFSATAEDTGDEHTVRVICSTEDMDRAGEVIVQAGIDLAPYKANPIVLWQHDPMHPVGEATDIRVEEGRLVATVRFAPPGVSPEADKVRGLVKAGIVRGVSVGINPLDTEPMDAADTRKSAPVRYLKSELMEFSFVSIPANPSALIVSRSAARRAAGAPVVKSLYDIGCLARLLGELGYIRDNAAWEREFEGDASTVPEQLGEALKGLAEALLAMTAEEVAELLAAPMPGEDAKEAAATPLVTRFLAGWNQPVPAVKAAPATPPAIDRARLRRKAHALALG